MIFSFNVDKLTLSTPRWEKAMFTPLNSPLPLAAFFASRSLRAISPVVIIGIRFVRQVRKSSSALLLITKKKKISHSLGSPKLLRVSLV